jgi:hypothetical protein
MSDEEIGRTGRRTFMKATGALGVGTGIALTAGAAATAETQPGNSTNSFDNTGGGVVLNPGTQTTWTFGWGDDHGFQIAGPNPLQPLNGAKLTFFDTAKSMSGGAATYWVTIRNDGGAATVHNLEGGGLT